MTAGKLSQNTLQGRRRGLLAKVHIAKKELHMMDADYRDILENEFYVKSAAVLSLRELERLVKRMKDCGWRPKPGKKSNATGQIDALKERARAIAGEMENGQKRLDGLVRKICGVERLDWARDVEKLKRLIVVLGKVQ